MKSAKLRQLQQSASGKANQYIKAAQEESKKDLASALGKQKQSSFFGRDRQLGKMRQGGARSVTSGSNYVNSTRGDAHSLSDK